MSGQAVMPGSAEVKLQADTLICAYARLCSLMVLPRLSSLGPTNLFGPLLNVTGFHVLTTGNSSLKWLCPYARSWTHLTGCLATGQNPRKTVPQERTWSLSQELDDQQF